MVIDGGDSHAGYVDFAKYVLDPRKRLAALSGGHFPCAVEVFVHDGCQLATRQFAVNPRMVFSHMSDTYHAGSKNL